ncbi:MAG: LamG-like jellyroll fold domain-containing protein [Marinobacter sp.]|nr:LamG-like jellyroll fold domain-containing protein [Marinobacter sp.]
MINSTKLPRAGTWLFFGLAMALLPIKVLAECSAEYVGLATINELSDKEQFIEVKILSATIEDSIYSDWSLDFCSTDGKNNPTVECAFDLPLSGAGIDTDGEPWLVRRGLGDAEIDLAGLDVRLKDDEGRTIDYVRVGPGAGDPRVPDPGCDSGDLPYDNYLPLVGGQAGQFARRMPDGTGDWSMSTGASDGKSTDSETNDGDSTGPEITVDGDGVFAGNALTFEISLSEPLNSDTSITFSTRNDTAEAPGDYQPYTDQTLTIPANSTTATVSIATVEDGDRNVERMFLELSSSSEGYIAEGVAIGEIWPNALGLWRFEQDATDSSGNGLDGDVSLWFGYEDRDPARGGNPGTCFYGELPNDIFEYGRFSVADNDLLDLSEALTVTAWVRRDESGSGYVLSKGGNYQWIADSDGRLFWSWDGGSLVTAPDTLARGQWVHVAVTYRSGEQILYINGQVEDTGTYTGSLTVNTDDLTVGRESFGDVWGTSSRFDGAIDELHIYGDALSQAAISRIYGLTYPCGQTPVLSYFQLEIPASASVCTPITATLTAYDTTDSVMTGYEGEVNLSTSSGHGRWNNGTGAGVLSPAPDTSDDGAASYQFDQADAGEVDLVFSNTHADQLTITAWDQAAGVSVTSNPVEFVENALFIENNDTLGDDLIAGRTHSYQVSMLKRDADSQECGVATDYDGIHGLKAWLERSAEDPGGQAPKLDSSEASLTTPSTQPANNNFTVNFDAGTGGFTLTPPDVGRYTLNLLDDTSGFAQDLNGDPLPIISASANAPWTARPFAISVEAMGNPGATDASGPVYRIAGEDFTLRVGGRVYDSNDDGDGNGIVDAGANPLDNGLAASFGIEGETVVLSHQLIAPDPANAPGQLSGPELQAADFSNGLAEKAGFQFDEVGIIDLSGAIKDGNYLGAGGTRTDRIRGARRPVGRFRPAWFEVSIDPGTFSSVPLSTDRTTCATARNWVYTGEPFGWEVPAEISITPKNLNASTVENYAGTPFQLMDQNDLRFGAFPASDIGTNGVDGTPLQLEASLSAASLGAGTGGTLLYTFATGDEFRYPKSLNTRVPGFAPQPVMTMEDITDDDSVTVADPATDLPRDFTPTATFEIRYGRITLENSYGPEDKELTIPMTAEVYGSGGFEPHLEESCWFYNLAENTTVNYDNSVLDSTQTEVVEVTDTELTLSGARPRVSPSNYDYRLRLSAPEQAESADEQGIYVGLDAGNDWLRDYWDADNPNVRVNPYAWATFGVYRGNDRIIYWQEVLN